MAVLMKRSTNMAPVSLSTSYLIGWECAGISMMTLTSLDKDFPESTRSRFMAAPGRSLWLKCTICAGSTIPAYHHDFRRTRLSRHPVIGPGARNHRAHPRPAFEHPRRVAHAARRTRRDILGAVRKRSRRGLSADAA